MGRTKDGRLAGGCCSVECLRGLSWLVSECGVVWSTLWRTVKWDSGCDSVWYVLLLLTDPGFLFLIHYVNRNGLPTYLPLLSCPSIQFDSNRAPRHEIGQRSNHRIACSEHRLRIRRTTLTHPPTRSLTSSQRSPRPGREKKKIDKIKGNVHQSLGAVRLWTRGGGVYELAL